MKKWICVFCASSTGRDAAYLEAARQLGRAIAAAGYGLVYGGATAGTMGVIADAVLAGGGPVFGVIPRMLVDREIGHPGLTELLVVETMHERKAAMAERADAFVALPGGYGTLDEFIEVLTWAQLRIHTNPCVLLNVNGYYDGLLAFLDSAVNAGFLRPENRSLVQVAQSVAEALALVERSWAARDGDQSLDPERSPLIR
jgi:uncharacterized protein (TIGR00730 family)